MKCPLCKKGKLVIGQDAILYHKVTNKKEVTVRRPKIAELDDCWLECPNCSKTSNDDQTLEELFEEINDKYL